MMYSTYKLNKQGDDIQPWHTPFPIWNQYFAPYPVLTVVSRPAYPFCRRQVWWPGITVSKNVMFKLVLEKAEEPEIKMPAFAGSWKKQENSRKTSISALLTIPKPLTVWITTNCGKF